MKPNINKQQFLEYIDKIKETFKKDEELSTAIEKACDNDCFIVGLYTHECSTLVNLLSLAMGLEVGTRDGNILEYFIYELDFGKDYTEGCYSRLDDTPIDISTPEKLYEFIISETENDSDI